MFLGSRWPLWMKFFNVTIFKITEIVRKNRDNRNAPKRISSLSIFSGELKDANHLRANPVYQVKPSWSYTEQAHQQPLPILLMKPEKIVFLSSIFYEFRVTIRELIQMLRLISNSLRWYGHKDARWIHDNHRRISSKGVNRAGIINLYWMSNVDMKFANKRFGATENLPIFWIYDRQLQIPEHGHHYD